MPLQLQQITSFF